MMNYLGYYFSLLHKLFVVSVYLYLLMLFSLLYLRLIKNKYVDIFVNKRSKLKVSKYIP